MRASGLLVAPEGFPDVGEANLSAGLSAYVHVPFCAARCGYCDFNTYTKLDFGEGASVGDYPDTLAQEVAASARLLSCSPPFTTVYIGGGTPTMLPPAALGRIIETLKREIGIAPDAEITTEANPETVTESAIDALAEAGFTRISFGMQSASEPVLRTLDRQHTHGQVARAVRWAQKIGLDVSVDLIYGTPGETEADWTRSLHAALDLNIDHISAYALTIEAGTPLGARLRRGLISPVDPDVQAERYEQADAILHEAGLSWYEISNWARPGHECRHNLVYWTGGNWWGYGPGAHSHIDGVRFWNLKHPLAYARTLSSGRLPIDGFEKLGRTEREEERIMLALRLARGFDGERAVLERLEKDGLVESCAEQGVGHVRLTLRGRLLADEVTRQLWETL